MISSCPVKNAKKPSHSYSVKPRQDTGKKFMFSRASSSNKSSRYDFEEGESSTGEEQDTGKLNIVENQDGKLLRLNGLIG